MQTTISISRRVTYKGGLPVHKMIVTIETGPNSRLTDTILENAFRDALRVAEEEQNPMLQPGYDANGMYTLPDTKA